ncbi:MAG: hypothetical protein JJU11_02635 [Candidatus Sumerlaeia bacterium]|nr:hypothetical protein [Candidatus Sumerlaeia bacterium]
MTFNINVDSRLLDRLNAACGVLLGAAAIMLVVMTLQPSLNPPSAYNGYLTIELRGPDRPASENQQAAATETANEREVALDDSKSMDSNPPGG